ncbi:PREDICTED: BEL1-like homeodomain protein 11 [Populus euphratica]|uniref:BEL1-like homeodomain protein 11 n=1 Tax=Populus euphratica TaxID=75702 RepID=A0AAJ6YAU0_POPEU|nr:PREDICTED: BEL1-like homeodomain protein 11 [Populus euphratica]XP_011048825.1 PREDICTED: BEL1-like homeodomain protein 11 [Populus euphratica]XP_011048826.1 PREDICTED: BEL1-like homeodomain protein 11 [Populus euphratica]
MVSQDSSSNSASSMLHQFIISDSISSQNQYQNQNFDVFGSDLGGSNTFPHSHRVLPSIQSLEEGMSRSIDLVQAPSEAQESEISHTRHLMNLLGAANETNRQAQRLSLSLGSHMLVPQVQYRQRSFNLDLMSPSYLIPREEEAREAYNPGGEQVNNDYSLIGSGFTSSSASFSRRSPTAYGTESFAVAIENSRYLKPAQSLLEESVHVSCKAVEISNEKYVRKLIRCGGSLGLSSELKAELWGNGLVQAEKHEVQLKIAKLIALLEEVEGRYEKYYHQMEEVVSSFEEMAGLGVAKSYTALALQAMSKHFCYLRDAIVSQINETRRKFSQDLPKTSSGLSQLSFFDKETKHNRMSLQQLGMTQSQRQAWRPIRGLPETSVAILRSWLFEHFLHPYPNESEKLMLASQTGLTKNQVSNWFINARVRLWKPMIEEMYKVEFADSSEDSNTLPGSSFITREGVTDHSED